MPFIEAKVSISLNDDQKSLLQKKLSEAVSQHLSKPTTYIMSEISDNSSLYMANNKMEKGAYISVRLLGGTTKDKCAGLTKDICNILKSDYDIDGSNVYVSYHPVELWGWNNMMF